MNSRRLGEWTVPAVGLGCMNLSHLYGEPPPKEHSEALLQRALDLGIEHFDTAALYGFGRNEELVGPFLKPHRDKVVLASKGGMRAEDGVRTIDGRPEKLREDIENSLRRLQTDVIDLYYLHRIDKGTPVPVEDSFGEMSRFIDEGKVRALGLSEASADSIRRAHAVHPVAAVQSEYALWSRNAELGVLDTCANLGIAFIAFAPLGRGFLTSVDIEPATLTKDIRPTLPRFQEPHFSANLRWLPEFRALAGEAGCTPAQLALAWVLQRNDHVHAIPGTTSFEHLEEDWIALEIGLSNQVIERLEALVNQSTVSGPRYPARTQAEIDTEEFEDC